MTNYDIKFIKQAEQGCYYVNDSKDANKPQGWQSIKTYENSKTGFKSEAFIDEKGQKILVLAGTNPKTKEDWSNNWQLFLKQIPQQAYDAYLAYEDFNNKYGNGEIIVLGYSLGASIAQIICNETGAKGITFSAYGVRDVVEPKHANNIINFGNEYDPVFSTNINKHLGKIYIIPDESPLVYKGTSITKHLPNQIGDISKAIKYEDSYQHARDNTYVLDGYINKDYYDDSLFDISNKVLYNSGNANIESMNKEEIDLMLDQYDANGQNFPTKEEMDRRVRFGELIYVENYTRSDGTKVSGYYRRYPLK